MSDNFYQEWVRLMAEKLANDLDAEIVALHNPYATDPVLSPAESTALVASVFGCREDLVDDVLRVNGL